MMNTGASSLLLKTNATSGRLLENTGDAGKTDKPGKRVRSTVRAMRPMHLPEINYLDLLRLDHPSDFVMFRALQLSLPARHQITKDEPDAERPLCLTFLAYLTTMPHSTELIVEKSVEYPPRWRLSRRNKPTQRRDISKWKATGERLFVYTTAIPGTAPLHLDWQTSPDRYVLSTRDQPEALLTRCLSFYAYTVNQVWVLKAEGAESYRMLQGNTMPVMEGWAIVHAFRALDHYTLGTNRYYVQCLEDPFPRIRVAMTAANAVGWVDVFSFYAFDVPVSGTQRYSVYQRSSVPITRSQDPEQYKIGTGMVTGMWMWRLDFFAFPIPLPTDKGHRKGGEGY